LVAGTALNASLAQMGLSRASFFEKEGFPGRRRCRWVVPAYGGISWKSKVQPSKSRPHRAISILIKILSIAGESLEVETPTPIY
jgi:hypothetical protein